jgi:hypothetical protein
VSAEPHTGTVERADVALRKANVPPYVRATFRDLVPSTLTERTVDLLIAYLAHLRALPADRVILHGFEDSAVGRALMEAWLADDGPLDGLAKFVSMVEYRRRVIRQVDLGVGPAPSPEDLDAFWIAAGHDMTDLARFLRSVDREVIDHLPK